MFQVRVEVPNPNNLAVIDNHKEQYQELLQHPLFVFKNDPDLSPLIKTLDLIIQPRPQLTAIRDLDSKLKEHLFNLIFEKKKLAELQKSNQLNIVQKTTCGKHVAQGELYFRCLDCDVNTVPGTVSLLCTECFEKSNHEDHRVILVKKENLSTATCDCGIIEAFKPEGFCSDHQPYEINLKEFLQKFPVILFERYQIVLKKVFYGVISLYEIAQIVKGNKTRTAITTLAHQCLNELLSFCDDSIEEISESFLVILGNILKAPFMSPYNSAWHNCKDLKAEKLTQKTETLNCTCSILGSLFKFGLIMGKEQQSKIERLVTNCARDSAFKEFAAIEMAKFADFLFTKNLVDGDRESLTQESPNSRFLRMTTQLYQNEDMMLKVLETGYLDHFMEIFENVVQESKQVNFTVSYIINESICVIDLFLDRRLATSKILIKEKRTLNSLLKILANFEKRFLYDRMIHIGLFPHNVDYFIINFGLINEKSIRRVVMDGMKQIYKYPKEEKDAILKQFISDLYSNYQANIVPILNIAEDSLFNLALERTFTACLVNYVNFPITLGDLQDFFKRIVPAQIEVDKLSEQFIQSTLKSFGRLRYLTLVHNFEGGMIWGVYYDVAGSMFELDIVLVQLLSTFVNPENLFSVVSNSFFSYSKELQAFFSNPAESKVLIDDYFKQKLSVMEDFMNLLVYLMNDELSLVNLQFEKKEQQENIELDSRNKKVIEKVLTNILVGLYWTNVNQLKSVLETMFKSQAHVDEILKKITIINEKDHKIRIKDEYLSEFDSYMHYKSPAFKQELLSSLSSKTQLSQKTDLVSGRYFQDLPSNLKQTQKSFYQSTLPDFLARFLQEFPKEMDVLLRPALKLVLLNLQVLREAIATADNDQTVLRAKAEENYFNETFSSALTAILEQGDFKDCERCILNIQSLIKTLSSSTDTDLETKLAEEDFAEKKRIEVEEKKRLAKERMEKMKENFSKKQALFADKNKELVEAEDLNKSPETAAKDRITCQYCLEPIDTESTPYGVPLFVSYTNNLQFENDEEVKPRPNNFSNPSKAAWWPVVTSCNHNYHQGCFETHTINLRKPNEPINALFREESESQCSLCKTFSNGFLLQKPLALASTKDDIIPDLLPMTLQDLLKHKIFMLKDVVPVPLNLQVSEIVPSTLIFERAYSYLIQTFHTQSNPAALQAAIQLYTNFFRGFQYYFFHNQNSTTSQTQPFIDLLVKTLSTYQGEDSKYQELNLKVLKEYIAVRIEGQGYKTVEALRSSLKQTIWIVQKAVLSYHMNLSVLGQPDAIHLSELSSLLLSPDHNTEEYVIRLLKTIQDPSLTSLDALVDLLQTTQKTDSPPTKNIYPLSPQMIKIPATYAEFNKKYMGMKCSKCNTFGENMLRCICLICGDFICGLFCDSSKMVYGNLNRHCKEYHMGNGLFIDVHTQAYEVVSSGTNVVALKHQIYIDQLGQPVTKFLKDNNDVQNLDFKQFFLNPDALNLFKGIINSHSFRQEIFEVTYNNNSAFNDNTL